MFDQADAVHVSVTWTWDLPFAEKLGDAWKHVAPVTIGGPATGQAGQNFTPGMYVKRGYVAGMPEPLLVLLGMAARR